MQKWKLQACRVSSCLLLNNALFWPFMQNDEGKVCVVMVNKQRSQVFRQHGSADPVRWAGRHAAWLSYTWLYGSIGLYLNFLFCVIPIYFIIWVLYRVFKHSGFYSFELLLSYWKRSWFKDWSQWKDCHLQWDTSGLILIMVFCRQTGLKIKTTIHSTIEVLSAKIPGDFVQGLPFTSARFEKKKNHPNFLKKLCIHNIRPSDLVTE